ncbi:helix-turn-helix domain-containing protein [Actinoplanes awajinensis]|uniref:AraC family transcriptional regulator n=1 Tax=Actinoplanes awajinensis subsp. mycoplanecinus TaxID=135947 RepID=A0A0X3UXZ0_9ACTN|nr:helix-turn-helix domain-containing protein [Actinoplanes awajinensis]KUL37358.1 AraC family transcriptional regulator [Actinoplanes awajinensis subsp. mycoplanecinus]
MPAHIVVMPLTDRLPIFELAVPCEVFGIDRADLVDPWYDLRFCASEPGTLGTSSGPGIQVPYDLSAMDEADTIILPACSRPTQLNPPADLIAALQRAHQRGARMVSICTGAYLLAAAGLLDGRRATTHWMNVVDFAHRYPEVKVDGGVLFVDEGDILTSAGTGAAVDVCLHVVASDHGTAVAHAVARRMVVPPHRDGSQAQFVEPPTGLSRADELAPVLQWARQNLAAPLTVADLARRANMSQRTFARRFQEITGVSPLRWVLQQRIRCAQELLETTDESVEKVAQQAGFGSAAALRLHFQRAVAVPPQTYRHVFRTSRQRAL